LLASGGWLSPGHAGGLLQAAWAAAGAGCRLLLPPASAAGRPGGRGAAPLPL